VRSNAFKLRSKRFASERRGPMRDAREATREPARFRVF
jgi:hypothetical protein